MLIIDRNRAPRATAALIAALLSVGTLAACEEEAPAEKIGKKIDQTAEEAAKAVEDATK
ncbi:MAG TPA: hypothetical protein VJ924_09885 [Alphaproteobacteria bacterium]|nr:hypothetical protein [Alphaproteobacteria bacterium]